MKLLNDFYQVLSEETTGNSRKVHIRLNRVHPVFAGHFPGNPVVPGVCMVQIVKELMHNFFKKEFILKQAHQLKFLAIINPEDVPELVVELTREKEDENGVTISGSLFRDELIFMKYKALFTLKK